MFQRLNPSISYKLDQIDPSLDLSRDEGDHRLTPLRAVLRCVANKLSSTLVDANSEHSLGVMLSIKKTPEQGSKVLESFMSSSAPKKAKACLLKSSSRLLTTDEADELDEGQRSKCVAVSYSNDLAMPLSTKHGEDPSVIVTVDKTLCGGPKDGKIVITRNDTDAVTIGTYSTSGQRKNMKAHGIPPVLLDKLFAQIDNPLPSSVGIPKRKGDLPDYLRVAVAEFLERRMRLQVLCTASMPDPVSRPVVVDKAFMRKVDTSKKNLISIGVGMHSSSSSCICAAHGMKFNSSGCVDVRIETCGRPLQQDGDYMRCPCHDGALDESGNSRFNIEGMCTEGTSVSVACWHRSGSICKRGASIDSLSMTDADRLELSTILVNMAEFTTLSVGMFNESGWVKDRDALAKLNDHLSVKLRSSMEAIYTKQLIDRDPEIDHPKEMLRRDMVAVDLLRGGGVFRHVHKRGTKRGCPYIQRAKRAEDTPPLKTHETDIADTHAHLFRKAP